LIVFRSTSTAATAVPAQVELKREPVARPEMRVGQVYTDWYTGTE